MGTRLTINSAAAVRKIPATAQCRKMRSSVSNQKNMGIRAMPAPPGEGTPVK